MDKMVQMASEYNSLSAAHAYIVGYTYRKMVYFNTIHHLPTELMSCEMASRGAGYSLRLRVRKAMKAGLLPTATCLGSADILTGDGYNKGEWFEKAVTEFFGQEWHKDNVPFTKAGDINVNGVEIQIKFDAATFASEATLRSLRR